MGAVTRSPVLAVMRCGDSAEPVRLGDSLGVRSSGGLPQGSPPGDPPRGTQSGAVIHQSALAHGRVASYGSVASQGHVASQICPRANGSRGHKLSTMFPIF